MTSEEDGGAQTTQYLILQGPDDGKEGGESFWLNGLIGGGGAWSDCGPTLWESGAVLASRTICRPHILPKESSEWFEPEFVFQGEGEQPEVSCYQTLVFPFPRKGQLGKG